MDNAILKEKLDQMSFAIEAAELGTFDYNPLNNTFLANDRLKSWFGLPPEEEIDLAHAIAVIADIDKQRVVSAIEKALQYNTGSKYDIVYTIVHPLTRVETIVHAKGKAVFDEQHRAIRFTGILENVTQLQLTAARAIQNEQNIRSIVLESPVGICVLDAASLVCELVNNSFLAVAGKPYEAIAGRYYWHSFAEAAPYYQAALASVVAEGKPFYANEVELMLIRHGKEEMVFVTFVYVPLKDAKGKVIKVIVWVLENTQQVIARKKNEETTDKLNIVIEASGLGIYDLNLQTDALVCSDRFHQIFGYADGEQLTHPEFLSHLHPDDVLIRNEAHRNALATGMLTYQSRIIDKFGRGRWIDVRGKIFYDAQHKPALLIGTCGDITAIKEQEQQKDFFIGAASHELKTPITSIKGYVQLLQSLYAGNGDKVVAGALQAMNRQTDVLVKLISELLDVSKIKLGKLSLDKTVFNLYQLLQETIVEINTAHPGYNVALQSDHNIFVDADRLRISQVLINLLNNAIKHSAAAGKVTMSTVVQNQQVTISVKDFGVGISRKDQERIFERFFRVEAKDNFTNYDGFGIGLFISADIVQRHGGRLEVASEIGKGADFYFTLPLHNQ